MKPNYFLSVQVYNPEVHQNLEAVQDHMRSNNRFLAPALINLIELHFTLMVMKLNTEKEIEVAKSALEKCHPLVGDFIKKPITVQLKGLGNFNNHEVVFAKAVPGPELDRLYRLRDIVINEFAKHGIKPTDNKFTPHLTVAKIYQAKQELQERGITKINPETYRQFEDKDFGNITVCDIQLCAMDRAKPRQSSGYYHIENSIPCVSDNITVPGYTPSSSGRAVRDDL